jgi:hypothetical protein
MTDKEQVLNGWPVRGKRSDLNNKKQIYYYKIISTEFYKSDAVYTVLVIGFHQKEPEVLYWEDRFIFTESERLATKKEAQMMNLLTIK